MHIVTDSTSAPEFSTAPKAERAAKAWCEENANATSTPPPVVESSASEQVSAEAAARQPASAPAPTDDWLLVLRDDRGGTYQVDVLDPDTREPAPDAEVRGYETGAEAMEAARRWAAEHPRGKAPSGEAEGEAPESEPGLAPELPALDSDAIVEPEPAATATPSPSSRDAELEALRREVAEIRRRDAATRSDLDELAEDARRSQMLAREISDLEAQIKDLRDVKKGKEAELAILTGKTASAVVSLHDGRAPQPYQRKITFADSAQTRERVGAEAAQVVAQLDAGASTPAEAAPVDTWSFNGVEHRIERRVEQTADGERWTTWLKGHKDKTEEHGFTFEQALEATKTAASVVFADADPGSTAPSQDAGPLADGPKTPARRGRKPKFGKHDQAAVIAAVESHLTLPEAAMDLGCTPQQLEAYAEKAGLVLSKHQGSSAGAELPAPPMEKARKPRGRKRGG